MVRAVREAPYPPLADHALVGDCRTAALVSRDGSVDWACVPRFDGDAVFARLLDDRRGGSWLLAPVEPYASSFAYAGRSALLETEHRTAGGTVRVRDVFVPPSDDGPPGLYVRVAEGLAGSVELESVLDPRPRYGLLDAALEPLGDDALLVGGGETALRLVSTVGQRGRHQRFALEQGERAAFVLGWGEALPRADEAFGLVEEALSWWEAWAGGVAYDGPFVDAVVRSAITLKLCTYIESGGIVAAPTASLPERIGGDQNWDYRYTWLRDAALALYAFLATGLRAEGDGFFDWICTRVSDASLEREEGLRVMYDVDGGSDHREETLPHLEGYRESSPVRVGNAACAQTQLDVYGDVLDCFSTASVWGRSDKLELWKDYRPLADWICVHWEEPDSGIWELRGEDRHYVYSKVMAWVALDRAIRTAESKGLPGDLERWRLNKALIHASVCEQGWSDGLGGFKQAYDVERLDASALVVPLVGFLPPDDPRVASNLERTLDELATDGLVYRYADGDPGEQEGAFALCSFWLVNAFAAAGRIDEAAETFERVLARRSPLGLLSEEIDPSSGELLGNYPQSFVHAGLLSAAVNLARAGGLGEAPASNHAPAGTAHLVAAK